MLRYTLDALGWYEFEGLAQALLKTRLGVGVEAWGGSGDWGRDAYCDQPLLYPTNQRTDGPFVFQCKFVDGANAAGANADGALLKAVKKECSLIKMRIAPTTKNGIAKAPVWTRKPAVYSLITNAPASGALRGVISGEISAALGSANVVIHDGNDLCAWLDNAKSVVRSFPLLWGLRNLDDLLRQWVNADVLSRSKAALEESKEIASVFVPTKAYSRSIEVLNQHHFVVLEGPPEMGKTAIGRMIALTAVGRGWEAIECRSPKDVEASLQDGVQQVFLADDFFGRTEYDPQLVSNWQRELPHILRLLDKSHWLVLTTRAHLLNLAKQTLDLPGTSKGFPDFGEVIVDASDLADVEKARMLYRHLKRGGFPPTFRSALRASAEQTVMNPHFTPERIRRLAVDGLPRLLQAGGPDAKVEAVRSLISEGLANPTKSMRVSFRNLRPAEKWLLFSLVELESGRRTIAGDFTSNLETSYERLCPLHEREPFNGVLTALSQAFVRRSDSGRIAWVHPSCRDLAIEELGNDARLRTRFLEHTDIGGLRLAMSVGGGRGERNFPLLRSEYDWSILEKRLQGLNAHRMEGLTAGSAALETARSSLDTDDANLARLANVVCDSLWPISVSTLNSEDLWTVELAETYVRLGINSSPKRVEPSFDTLWTELKVLSAEDVSSAEGVLWDRCSNIDLFSRLVVVVRQLGLPEFAALERDIREVLSVWVSAASAERGARHDTRDWTLGEFEKASSGYATCGEAIKRLGESVTDEALLETVADACSEMERLCEDYSRDIPDYDREHDEAESGGRDVSVADLFSDL